MRARAGLFVLLVPLAACGLFYDLSALGPGGADGGADGAVDAAGGGPDATAPDSDSGAQADGRVDVDGGGADGADAASIRACDAPGLVAYWKLDDDSDASVLRDCSSRGNHLHVIDVIAREQVPGPPDGPPGGHAVSFPHGNGGTGAQLGHLEVGPTPDLAIYTTIGFTVTQWFYFVPEVVSEQMLIDADDGWFLTASTPSGPAQASFYVGDAHGLSGHSANTPNPGQWIFVAAVYKTTGTVSLWVNGIETPGPARPSEAGAPNVVWMGLRRPTNGYLANLDLQGKIGETRVFARELTAAEIDALRR